MESGMGTEVGGKIGTKNGIDKKPGQDAARIWLNSYLQSISTTSTKGFC